MSLRTRILAASAGAALIGTVPVLPPVWAAPTPVTPTLHTVTVSGVDATALAASPPALDPGSLKAAAATGPTSSAATPRVSATVRPALLTPVLTTGRFTAAGLSWAAGSTPAGVVVQVRVRDAGTWTDWEELDLTEAPQSGTTEAKQAAARVSTEPVSTPHGEAVQIRVDSDGHVAPRDVRLLTVDPGTSAADSRLSGTPAASASASTSSPGIITRAQWGADESMRDCSPTYMRTIKVGFVHHTVGSNSYAASDSAGLVRGIYAYHVNGNGWCDVGYNFLVDRFGQIFEGRAGGIDKPVLGAHTLAFNWNSFGVAAMGTFSTTATPAAMTGSIAQVLGYKLGLHGRNPSSTAVLTSAGGPGARWPEGTNITFSTVSGHRDAYSTECPGNVLYAQLGSLRQAASTYVATHSRTDQDLYGVFGTTIWPPSGKVELHAQSAASGYSQRLTDVATTWAAGKPNEWRFFVGSSSGDTRPDLIGVHTTGTASGRVEVREASWASTYQDTDVITTTPLATFTADTTTQVTVGGPSGGDLYFIFLTGGASRTVEVHSLTAASDYRTFGVHSRTALSMSYPSAKARFLVARGTGDLSMVLHQGTGSGVSELHVLTAASGYQTFSRHQRLPQGYTSDTTAQWILGTASQPDLALVLSANTGSKTVEVHLLSARTSYATWTSHSRTNLSLLGFPGWQFSMG